MSIDQYDLEPELCSHSHIPTKKNWSKIKHVIRKYVITYHSHVNGAFGQGFVAQNSPVLVLLSSLEHDKELILTPLQKVVVLIKSR